MAKIKEIIVATLVLKIRLLQEINAGMAIKEFKKHGIGQR